MTSNIGNQNTLLLEENDFTLIESSYIQFLQHFFLDKMIDEKCDFFYTYIISESINNKKNYTELPIR